jgi:hypothetical protein
MKMRSILLGVGIALFLCAVLGGLLDDAADGLFLWLLVPSFLLVGIGGDRNVWRKTETVLPANDFFAPNS